VRAKKPSIACLDLDTFFVSVERLLDSSLAGQPVVVGGRPGQRGVVTAASYEVRRFGVHSGMSMTEALRLAPGAIYLPTRQGVYGDYSKQVRSIVDRFSPAVQAASIDEFYIDLAGCARLYRKAEDEDDDATIERTLWELIRAIQEELGLPSSAGIGTSRAISKVACRAAKPAGVRLVPAGCEAAFLAPQPVRVFPGIGPVAEKRLVAEGIATLGQLQTAPRGLLRRVFGNGAEAMLDAIHGRSSSGIGRDRPAFREHDPVEGRVGSISNERTFREDVSDPSVLEAMLCSLCERVCWRARKRQVKARTVSLKLRYADFQTLSRSRSIPATSSESELFPVLRELYRAARTRSLPIRLLGVALSKFEDGGEQLGLFDADSKLKSAIDAIRARHDYDAVRVAVGRKRERR